MKAVVFNGIRDVAVLGCGPVGQLVIASAKLFDAGRAEPIDFSCEDAVETVREFTRDGFKPGAAPAQALEFAVGMAAKGRC